MNIPADMPITEAIADDLFNLRFQILEIANENQMLRARLAALTELANSPLPQPVRTRGPYTKPKAKAATA